MRAPVRIDNDGLYVASGSTFNTNLTINNNLTINGSLINGINVCKRSQFIFTPQLYYFDGVGYRYIYQINLYNYISTANNVGESQLAFNIYIWTATGDFGDITSIVENIYYVVQISTYSGGKVRMNSIYNNSNGSTISYINASTIYYNGWNGSGGASVKCCVIENIAGY